MLERNKSSFLKRIFIRAAKFPLLYLVIGIGITLFSYIDDFFPTFSHWKNSFDLTDQLGTIVIGIAVLTFFYNIIVLTCRRFELKLTEKHIVAAMILGTVRKSLRIIFVLVALNIIINVIGPSKYYAFLANSILNTIIISAIGWVALQVLYTFEAVLYQKMIHLSADQHARAKALYTKIHIMKNIAVVLIIVLTIAAILMTFNSVRNLGISLLASAGLLTAVIGFAAQKPLYSIFCGLQLALAQPIKLGDYVVVDAIAGTIEEITFTYVTIKMGDKRRLIVPINTFIEKHFENWSRVNGILTSTFSFYIDYAMPIAPLRKELERVLHISPYASQSKGKLLIEDLGERAVQIGIQISAQDPDNLSQLRAEVKEKLLEFIRQHYPTYFPIVRVKDGSEIAKLAP